MGKGTSSRPRRGFVLGVMIGLLVAAVVGFGAYILLDDSDGRTTAAGETSSSTPSPTPVTPTPSALSTTAGHLDRTFGDGGRAISGWSGSVDPPYWKIRGVAYGRAFDVDMQGGGRILLTGARASGIASAFRVGAEFA